MPFETSLSYRIQLFWVSAALIAGQASISSAAHRCNRDRSRLARSIITKYILPHGYWNSYDFPLECPLHPSQDMFSALESAKQQVSAHKWNCSLCGSKHSNEPELDQHLHAKHSDLILGEGQCLADLCDVLHCNYIAEEILTQKGPGVDPYARHKPCDPQKELVTKQKCREVAELCFPVEGGPKAPMMWGFFHGHVCLAHNCKEDIRKELLASVVDARPHIQWGFSIFAGFATTVLLGFYVIFWLYMRVFVGVMGEDEFTSLKPKREKSFWPWRKSKPKEL